MYTKLERIAEIARNKPKDKFTSLMHLVNKEMLIICHNELGGNKATGVDNVTKKEYGANLEANVDDLLVRLKSFKYKPQPVKRVYIDKAGSDKKRPLGIPTVNSYCTPPNSVFDFRLGLLRPSSYFT